MYLRVLSWCSSEDRALSRKCFKIYFWQAQDKQCSGGHLILEVDEEVEKGGQDVHVAVLEEGGLLVMAVRQ